MMAYSEDHNAFAAEYALGTLDAEERAQVEAMMSADKDFTAMVEAWEHKLGVLNQMVGSVEPRPEVWDKIRTATGLAEPQAPLVLPDAPQPVAAEVSEPAAVADTSNVIRLSTEVHRPKPRTQVVEVKTPSAPAPSAQYVAVLQKEGGAPGFIVTVDGATKNFWIRKVGASAEPGRSFELWLISDKLPQPRSLGVVGSGDFTARPVLASYDADLINTATYAVTVEQAGGSPDGKPHSAPVFTGKLIETVPRAAPAP